MITFFVDHPPVPQPRHRVTRWGSYIPKDHSVHGFKQLVQMRYLEATSDRFEGPVECIIYGMFARPKAEFRKNKQLTQDWYPKKCDADNIAKAVLDALNDIAWSDDRQVCRLVCEKRKLETKDDGWLMITIAELSSPPAGQLKME